MYYNNMSSSLSKKLKIISDKNRLKILCYLFNHNNPCVSDIANDLKMSVAIISHHLQKLNEENIVNSCRDGKKNCYKLSKTEFNKDLKKFICKYDKQ